MLNDSGNHAPCVVYISGPMTGTSDHGVALFSSARDVLRSSGYMVLCPSEASGVHQHYGREKHLRRDFSYVLLADEVCVLSGWERSKGAVIEVNIAIAVGLPVWEFETGQRIDALIAKQIDVRRSLVPMDFDAWFAEEVSEEPEASEGDLICPSTYVASRGASLSHCALKMGHVGEHRSVAGVGW